MFFLANILLLRVARMKFSDAPLIVDVCLISGWVLGRDGDRTTSIAKRTQREKEGARSRLAVPKRTKNRRRKSESGERKGANERRFRRTERRREIVAAESSPRRVLNASGDAERRRFEERRRRLGKVAKSGGVFRVERRGERRDRIERRRSVFGGRTARDRGRARRRRVELNRRAVPKRRED